MTSIIERIVEPVRLEGREVYGSALRLVMACCAARFRGESLTVGEELFVMVDRMVDHCAGGPWRDEALFREVLSPRSGDLALYRNPVNTAFLALWVGERLGCDRPSLTQLAYAALLHEVSMCQFWYYPWIDRPLSSTERFEMEGHVEKSAMLVGAACGRAGSVAQAVATVFEEHEREDGTGYPRRLRKNRIHPLAKILGVVDTFDALVSARGYRTTASPAEAVRRLLGEREKFGHEYVKALVEVVTVYPPGTRVKLNSGHLAEVVATHPDAVLRPVVMVRETPDSEPYRMDLREFPMFRVESLISEN